MIEPAQTTNATAARIQRLSLAASAVVASVGAVVVVGWILDVAVLKSVYGDITMKANAAVALVLTGVSVFLLNSASTAARRVGQACAVVTLFIGAATLTEHLFGWNVGIDQLLFTEEPGAAGTTSPGRIGPPSSTAFTLASVALLLFYARRRVSLAQVLSLFVGLIGLFAVLGYAYGAEQLYGIAHFTGIALHTAVALCLLSFGLLTARVDEGFASIIASSQPGGAMARRLWPTAILAPFIVAWLRVIGQRAGYYDLGFGTALLVLVLILILAAVIWHTALKLNHLDDQRLATEAAIVEKNEGLQRQAALIELSYEPIFTWELEGGILDWNKGCERLYGFSKHEAIGRASHELLRTKHPVSLTEYLEDLRQKSSWSGEVRHYTSDDREVIVESRQQLIESRGRLLVLETNRDVNEVRRAESSRVQLAAIVESSDDAIISKTLEGIITSWNKAAERIFGYSAEEVIGKSILTLIPLERHDEEPRIIANLKRGERIEHYETVRLRKDGRLVDVSLTVSPIRNSAGQTIGASKIARDITENKKAERERERLLRQEQLLRAEAERANRLKDEFLATVSHELRTPLNAILGWATMLRTGKLNQSDLGRAVETIERNARAQAELIEDLLDVSRIISGKLRLEIAPVDLISVINAAIDSVRPAANAKGIELRVSLDESAAGIHGDANRLQQVVWNLLSNAVKFTSKGGLVEIGLARNDSKAEITVTDTGEGISPEFLPYVFDRFQQADGSVTRKHGGLGLGLAIARHLLEMHGGTIEVTSGGLGRGSRFTVKLPLNPIRIPAITHADESQSRAGHYKEVGPQAPTLERVRIIAVDDEPDTRDMLKGVLESFGASVLAVGSAREVLEAMAAWRPDVLICDIGMPEEDGYGLIRQIRALEPAQGRDTPAIALTGYVRVEERMRALAAGYQMFVPKPVEAAELASVIAGLIRPHS
jgi:PAS domain S-box-containing protein